MESRIQCVVGGASWYVEPGLAREKTICEVSRGGKIRLTSVRNDFRNFARALKAGISTFEHPRRCSSVAFHSFCARAKFSKSVSNILIRIFHENIGFLVEKVQCEIISGRRWKLYVVRESKLSGLLAEHYDPGSYNPTCYNPKSYKRVNV